MSMMDRGKYGDDTKEYMQMEIDKLKANSLEHMLDKIAFKSLESKYVSTGTWAGHAYILHTHNYGNSGPCRTLDEVKDWITKNLGWQLR